MQSKHQATPTPERFQAERERGWEPRTLQKAYQWVLSYSLAQPSTYAVFTASHFPVPYTYSSIALPTPSFHCWEGMNIMPSQDTSCLPASAIS